MGLIDILTNPGEFKFYTDGASPDNKFGQNKMQFSKDSKPFVVKPIGYEPWSISKKGGGIQPLIIRGGELFATQRAVDDVVRLTKFFATPAGLMFTLKQNMLSTLGVKTDANKVYPYNGLYSPTSTVAQAGIGFTGIHLNKQGLDPTGLLPAISQKKYSSASYDSLTKYRNNPSITSHTRLEDLYGEKYIISDTNVDSKTYGILDKYWGGPDSIAGIGFTKILFAIDSNGEQVRTGINNLKYGKNKDYLTNTDLKNSSINESKFQDSIKVQSDANYISQITLKTDNKIPTSKPIFTTINGTSTFYPIDPTSTSEVQKVISNLTTPIVGSDPIKGYFSTQPASTDNKINLIEGVGGGKAESWYGWGIKEDFRHVSRSNRGIDPRSSNEYDYTYEDMVKMEPSASINGKTAKTLDKIYYQYASTTKRASHNLETEDYIPFKISVVSPVHNVSQHATINFRAYLDNISDSYSAGWTPQKYMGRAESFYKYNSFGRDVSFGFTIVADSKKNLIEMYHQLNILASSLAPSYTYAGYMAGNLHQLTLGDYFKGTYGIIHSLNYELTTESPWGITIGEQVPFYIKVSNIKFTPIHNYRPEYKGIDIYENRASDRKVVTDPNYLLDLNESQFLDIRTGKHKDEKKKKKETG